MIFFSVISTNKNICEPEKLQWSFKRFVREYYMQFLLIFNNAVSGLLVLWHLVIYLLYLLYYVYFICIIVRTWSQGKSFVSTIAREEETGRRTEKRRGKEKRGRETKVSPGLHLCFLIWINKDCSTSYSHYSSAAPLCRRHRARYWKRCALINADCYSSREMERLEQEAKMKELEELRRKVWMICN